MLIALVFIIHARPQEENILQFWKETDAFKEQLRRSEGRPQYVFYDGPPFATGLPHYGHILAGTIKDVVTRFACSTGHHVTRRFGWDCHGLPVEYEIDKKLAIKGREDVLKLGIDRYNEECRSIVMRYAKEWEKTVSRTGRWIDFENDYKTLDPNFMESVWWVFKSLWEKDMVYKGFKVMPYSTACNTPLSNFEAGLDYRDVSDPAVMVSFPIIDCKLGAAFVAWTTTPWTLPSNLALCVNPEFTYVYIRNPSGRVFVVAEVRVRALPGASKKIKGAKSDDLAEGWEVLKKVVGMELKDLRYQPIFPFFAETLKATAFKVCVDSYVTDDSGTGVVHQAPAYGEDDYRVCLSSGIIEKGGVLPDPVDVNGCFCHPVSAPFVGKHVKEADKDLIVAIKELGRLVDNARLVHSYPYCWRSHTPLIYKAVASYFVKVEDLKSRLLDNNAKTYWVPSYVKEKRFHNWLENAHDWSISRNRYWGTPIPVWCSEDGNEVRVFGSIKELEDATGKKINDIHRHFIDHLEVPSSRGSQYPALRRVDDVFDCWFESGSMPYAQQHYPFENKEQFETTIFPAHFIAEGLDQTRGWFYTLMVLSTALFDRPAFQNLVCNGLVLAADGKKMSKSLKNYPDPNEILNKYGADALRLYLINSPVVRAEPLRFKEEGVYAVLKDLFLPWYNAYRFLVQNVRRVEKDTGHLFDPLASGQEAVNVLDRWITSATSSLVTFVKTEMEAYRLYTVVPRLVSFIGQLTNVYVRYNRSRLKGKNGDVDTRCALAALFNVLLVLCKTMAPFTPFFTESMYQNLRLCLANKGDSEPSVHFCLFPEAAANTLDKRVESSVALMQAVIETGRQIRERNNKPLKTPLRRMIVAHDSRDFLADLQGELRDYVVEELNVRELEVCEDSLKYATVKAEPNFAILGKRLGKSMGVVSKAIKEMSRDDIVVFQETGIFSVGDVELSAADVVVKREFCLPEGYSNQELDAATGEADVMVIMELTVDQSLVDAGAAREFVNRIQKLRKSAGLQASDEVSVYFEPISEVDKDVTDSLLNMLVAEQDYLEENLGCVPRLYLAKPANAEVISSGVCSLSTGAEFVATLAKTIQQQKHSL
jgi:isoleucyl-tRNA synthetase